MKEAFIANSCLKKSQITLTVISFTKRNSFNSDVQGLIYMKLQKPHPGKDKTAPKGNTAPKIWLLCTLSVHSGGALSTVSLWTHQTLFAALIVSFIHIILINLTRWPSHLSIWVGPNNW